MNQTYGISAEREPPSEIALCLVWNLELVQFWEDLPEVDRFGAGLVEWLGEEVSRMMAEAGSEVLAARDLAHSLAKHTDSVEVQPVVAEARPCLEKV